MVVAIPSRLCVGLLHPAAAKIARWRVTERRIRSTNSPQQQHANGCVTHAQCFLLAPFHCRVVTWSSLPVVCCLPGTCLGCLLLQGRESGDILPVRTYQVRSLLLKPRKSFYPLPPRNNTFERPSRDPEVTDRADPWTNISGRAARLGVLSVWPKNARTKGTVEKKMKNSKKYLRMLSVE